MCIRDRREDILKIGGYKITPKGSISLFKEIRNYKMILQTGILYGLLTDVFIYLLYNRVLRRVMNYYMAHVLQFLHLTSNVPNLVLIGIMVLNVVIAVAAVMFPAWKMGRENIIDEIRG